MIKYYSDDPTLSDRQLKQQLTNAVQAAEQQLTGANMNWRRHLTETIRS